MTVLTLLARILAVAVESILQQISPTGSHVHMCRMLLCVHTGNLLKPQLARGELRCIGATTLDEYRKYIEKDPALERRFQQVRRHQLLLLSYACLLTVCTHMCA